MKETRFKPTEIGLIPEDWVLQSVGKDCIVKARIGWQGLTTSEYMHHGEYGLITSTDIINGKVNWNSCYFVSKFRYEQDKNIIIKVGDILISKDGTIGKVGIVYEMPFPATLNSGVFVVRSRNQQIQKATALAFISPYFKDFIKRLTAGSTIIHLYQKDIVKFTYPVPKYIDEQNNIASALTSIDNLLLSLDKLIEKKKLIKQGAMQELLTGKKRLPGFTGEWVERRLGEISKIYRGGSPRPIENYLTTMNDGINWIKIGDVDKSAKYIYKTHERIKPSGISSSRYVKSGDFLLSNSMSFGRPYILRTSGCIHDGWLVIQDYHQNCDCNFLYYTLSSNYILLQYKAKAAGSSVLNLNKNIASGVIIKYPKELQEQQAIAEVLSSMDKEIESLEAKKAKYEQIKLGMMQQLLTGKIRLIS